MNPCSVLFVDRQPLRTAPIRAHMRRYLLDCALSSAAPETASPQLPVVMQGDPDIRYYLWMMVIDNSDDLRAWQVLSQSKDASWANDTLWVALRPGTSKLSLNDLNQPPFDRAYTLPMAATQIDELLTAAGCPLQPAPPDTYLQVLPLLDDTSAQNAAMGDSALVNELRAMLRDDLRQRIEQTAVELSRNDIAEAAETVHRLVGGCAYCGAKALQTASLEFENYLRQREVDKVDEAYGRWLQAAEQLLPALDQA